MNDDGMLATVNDGNIVVTDLQETNSKTISLTKTIARRQLAITSSIAHLNQFIPKIRIKCILRKSF